MMIKTVLSLLLLALPLQRGREPDPAMDAQADHLRALVSETAMAPLEPVEITVAPPSEGWEMGMVSWVAAGDDGLTYLLQRGENADPIVVVNKDGELVRSWGKGLYETAHAIRIDPDGNVWTADAKSSMVIKYSPTGEVLMEISVGGQPADCNGAFCGTSDVAFGPDGRIFIADGYRNARILEYTADGTKVREWGTPGTGPGEFRLPHSIALDDEGVIYVADRENGRIQRFDLEGNFLGMWTEYGKTFGLQLVPGGIWLATQHRNERNLSPGYLLKVDRETGKLLSYVNISGVHGMSALDNGELMVAPGPDAEHPQWFRGPQ